MQYGFPTLEEWLRRFVDIKAPIRQMHYRIAFFYEEPVLKIVEYEYHPKKSRPWQAKSTTRYSNGVDG